MKTYADWNKNGFMVKKGEKCRWINGVPMFDRTQVCEKAPSKQMGLGDYAYGVDDCRGPMYGLYGNCD